MAIFKDKNDETFEWISKQDWSDDIKSLAMLVVQSRDDRHLGQMSHDQWIVWAQNVRI